MRNRLKRAPGTPKGVPPLRRVIEVLYVRFLTLPARITNANHQLVSVASIGPLEISDQSSYGTRTRGIQAPRQTVLRPSPVQHSIDRGACAWTEYELRTTIAISAASTPIVRLLHQGRQRSRDRASF